MPIFKCSSCDKVFTRKQMLQYHVDHNVCSKENKFECPKCNRIFARKSNLQYHVDHKVCEHTLCEHTKNNHRDDPYNSDQYESDTYQNMSKDELMKNLVKCNKIIEYQRNLIINGNNNNINNGIINNNNTINLTVNFGQEKIEDIQLKLPNLLEDALHKHLIESVPYLTQKIHCNEELFPQYANVYMDSYRTPYAMVYNNGKFRRQPKDDTIDSLIDQCIRFLGNHVDDTLDINDKNDRKIIDKYEKYRDSIDESGDKKGDARKQLERELIGILLDQGDRLRLDKKSENKFKEYLAIETDRSSK